MLRLMSILFLAMIALTACSGAEETTSTLTELPAGDPDNGQELYNQRIGGAPTCASCHSLEPDTAILGPSLANYAAVAGSRVAGQSAEEYTYHSIVNVDEYLVEGFGNAMYANYGSRLSDQQLADIISYLLTLDASEE